MQCGAEEPGECSAGVVSKSYTQLLVYKRLYFSANYASSLYSGMVIVSVYHVSDIVDSSSQDTRDLLSFLVSSLLPCNYFSPLYAF